MKLTKKTRLLVIVAAVVLCVGAGVGVWFASNSLDRQRDKMLEAWLPTLLQLPDAQLAETFSRADRQVSQEELDKEVARLAAGHLDSALLNNDSSFINGIVLYHIMAVYRNVATTVQDLKIERIDGNDTTCLYSATITMTTPDGEQSGRVHGRVQFVPDSLLVNNITMQGELLTKYIDSPQ